MAYEILFIDSDILLDIILVREQHFNASVEVLTLAGNDKYECCTSVHSLLNIHYLTKKLFGEKSARQSIKMLIEKFKIIPEDVNTVKQAIQSNFSDFEDAVQYYAAISAKADVIITRNIKDYKQSIIPVLTAEQFLRTL
jgi:predicted nucleic acid-binding protein